MEQCLICKGYLFFKPLPDETYVCCQFHGEKVEDIDLRKGVSPAIERHGLQGVCCRKFKAGSSICHTSRKNPFFLHPVRETGEDFLRKNLGLEG